MDRPSTFASPQRGARFVPSRSELPLFVHRLRKSLARGPMRVSVVFNPRAGAGNAARQLPALRGGLEHPGVAGNSGDAATRHATIARHRAAIERGCTRLAIVGGDGDTNEASQAYIEADGAAQPDPHSPSSRAERSAISQLVRFRPSRHRRRYGPAGGGRRRPLDLGVITLHDTSGCPRHRGILNVASVGISGDVDERVERGPKWPGGKTAFLIATWAPRCTRTSRWRSRSTAPRGIEART